MSSVLVCKDLKKYYKSNFQISTIKAVDSISFEAPQGDVYGFIGHNGAGKTTTIKIFTGLIKSTGGEAWIMGKKVGNISSLSEVGFLPERPYFYEYLTAYEALKFYGKLHGMTALEISKRSDELLEMLDLQEAAKRPMHSYSKGMLQRFGMAQALIHDPQLIILDEPMSGLDPVGRGQIKDIIRMLKKTGKTIFFSTHILSDVEQLCDRVALIASGKLWYSGTVDDLTGRYEEGTEFVLKNLTDTQAKLVASFGGTFDQQPIKSTLFLQKGADIQAILAKLLDHEIAIEQFVPRKTSLEEIFVKEFGKEEEAEVASRSDRP